MKPKSIFRSTGLISVTILAATPFAAGAQAQASDPEAEIASEIVVTGSRVARSGFEQPTPTIVAGADLMARTAAANVADALNTLPQLRSSLTPSANSASATNAGRNVLDLRGLGAQRTLVLVDGQRFVSSILEGPVDINAIPQALIESTDIVTGGASAAYGSDAVAGVVNFRLLKQLDGFKGTFQGGISDRNDFRSYLASAAYGTSFADGRAHLILSGEAAQNSGITSIFDRPWAADQRGLITNPNFTPTNGQPAQLLLSSNALTSNSSYGGVITSGPLRGTQFGPNGAVTRFNYGTLTTAASQQGGDGAYTYKNWYLATPTKRRNAFGRFTFEVSDALKITTDLSYAHTDTHTHSSTRADTVTISADNAFLPSSVREAMVANNLTSFAMGRFNQDIGFLDIHNISDTWRGAVAATGDLGGGWSYDAYYTHGDSKAKQKFSGNRITANFALAVDSIIDPATGAAVCRNVAARAAGCVPINLFGDGSPSEQAKAYVLTNGFRSQRFKQDAAEFSVRGTPFSTWAGPVSIAAGGSYRRESTAFDLSVLAQQFALVTANGLPWQGKVSVKEAFGEVVVPLARDMAFANSIDLNLAGRITDYSTSGTVETWKAGLSWAIDRHFRLRGTISRDIKAPAVQDLYSAILGSLVTALDPQVNASYLVQTYTSGNPNLKPEKATTKTVGAVVQGIVPGFRASVDYYDIGIRNAIGSLTAAAVLQQCFNGDQSLCSLITRGADGRVSSLSVVPLNLQTLRERGLDIVADYGLPIGPGKLTLNGNVNYVSKLSYRSPTGVVDLTGSVFTPFQVGANGIPKWRGTFAANYAVGGWNLYADARFISAARINNAFTAANLNILKVPSVTYFDASVSYKIFDGVEAFAKFNNILDKNPPLTTGNFGTEASIYDIVGRSYAAGVRFKF